MAGKRGGKTTPKKETKSQTESTEKLQEEVKDEITHPVVTTEKVKVEAVTEKSPNKLEQNGVQLGKGKKIKLKETPLLQQVVDAEKEQKKGNTEVASALSHILENNKKAE